MNKKLEKHVRVFSFGGGWQSVAVAILQSQGKIEPYDFFIHANVGNDSENPDTVRYIKDVFQPWAEAQGIVFVEVAKEGKTLLEYTMSDENKTIPIPVYLQGAGPANRTCTQQWKIVPVNRWIKQQGYTHAVIGLGFSMDEGERARPEKLKWHDYEISGSRRGGSAKPKKIGFWRKDEYPLIQLRLFRSDLQLLFDQAGLPTPPKSACWFCPFSSRSRWIEMKRRHPEQFEKAVDLERRLNEKRRLYNLDDAYLHVSGKPLSQAVGDQMPLWDFETGGGCESGVCFT